MDVNRYTFLLLAIMVVLSVIGTLSIIYSSEEPKKASDTRESQDIGSQKQTVTVDLTIIPKEDRGEING